MKRYVNLSMAPVNMAENEAGEWVQYSEVKDLEEQNTENERIINSLYNGSSDSKVLKELKTVESCESYPDGVKLDCPSLFFIRYLIGIIEGDNNER